MTATPAAVERQSAPTPQRLNELSEIQVRKAIHRRARELADQAPPLNAQQIVLLRAVFGYRSGGGG
jgi:hypothetical protein